MNINCKLSTESIESVIKKLSDMKDDFDHGAENLVSVLTHEGAMKASQAFGRMAKVTEDVSENKGVIRASGRGVGIAEFGAGYATMVDHPLAGNAPWEVDVASYSKAQYPYGLFYITNDLLGWGEGYWFFGGKEYHEVPPRHGLLNARNYIMENGADIAREVFSFD